MRIDKSCYRIGLVQAFIVLHALADCQAQAIRFTGSRPFVIGFAPVLGPAGGVGGVMVDADGVLKSVQVSQNASLDRARERASAVANSGKPVRSPLRKISLVRLESEIARRVSAGKPLSDEILYLAGLQRIEYVFVYPESHDLVIGGPAAPWVRQGDDTVGGSDGTATLRLDDLLDAMQSRAGLAGAEPITCSIDPRRPALAQLKTTLEDPNFRLTEETLWQLERQLGDQQVTITGIRPSSHLARVMVAADYTMKRIAMDLEPSPVARLPAYLKLLQRQTRSPQFIAPRWWLAAAYPTAQRSSDGLAWRFQGGGIRAHSEHGYLNRRGELVNVGRANPLAGRWADLFTSHYDALAKQRPVFGQLAGCADLVLLAALIRQQDLIAAAGCALPLLTDANRLTGEEFTVPSKVPSQARVLRRRDGWVVSVSGGVDLDVNAVLASVQIDPQLIAVRDAAHQESQQWWWD